jgi:hypothetical protein
MSGRAAKSRLVGKPEMPFRVSHRISHIIKGRPFYNVFRTITSLVGLRKRFMDELRRRR